MKKMLVMLIAAIMLLTMAYPILAAPVKVTWVVWDNPDTCGYNRIAELFMKKHPDIKVEIMLVPYDRYEDKVRTLIGAGDAPDLIQVNDDYVVDYTKRNALLPLTRFIEQSGYVREDMFERVWDFTWVKNEMMAMTPVSKVRSFIYNVDAFKEAGLPMLTTTWEDPEWTWDTMLEYARKLTKTDAAGRTTQYGVSIYHDTGCEEIWIANANDEGIFSADGTRLAAASPEGTEALQFLADLTNRWHVQPSKGALQQITADNMFMTGRVAMMLGGTMTLPTLRQEGIRFEWDVAPIPMKKHGYQEGSLVCFGIPKNARNPEAAWKLLDFVMSDEALSVWAEIGFGIPARKSTGDAFIRPDLPPKNQNVFIDGMNYHKSVYFTEHTQRARQIFRKALDLVWNGERTAADVMAVVKDEVERALRGEY